MVKEMRVPSSSSSNSRQNREQLLHLVMIEVCIRTNSDWLDPDTLFNVCILGIIGVFALENFPSTESVDKGCPT